AGAATRITLVSGVTRGVTLPRPRRLARLPPGFCLVGSSMPLGLITGRPLRPFSRAISSRCAATSRFSSATSPNSSTTSASNSGRGRPGRSAGGDMHQPNRTGSRRGKRKNARRPGFCPAYAPPSPDMPELGPAYDSELDGTATPSARIVRSGGEGDGCILLIPAGGRLLVGPSTKGDHHVATTCADDRGHDPGWIGRRDAENLHPVGAPVGCPLPALAGPAQRGRGAGLPARLAPGRGGTRHIQDQPVRAAFPLLPYA